MDEIPKTTKNSVKEVSKVSIKNACFLSIEHLFSYTGNTIGYSLCIPWWAANKCL
jgi:hypothetical protein